MTNLSLKIAGTLCWGSTIAVLLTSLLDFRLEKGRLATSPFIFHYKCQPAVSHHIYFNVCSQAKLNFPLPPNMKQLIKTNTKEQFFLLESRLSPNVYSWGQIGWPTANSNPTNPAQQHFSWNLWTEKLHLASSSATWASKESWQAILPSTASSSMGVGIPSIWHCSTSASRCIKSVKLCHPVS